MRAAASSTLTALGTVASYSVVQVPITLPCTVAVSVVAASVTVADALPVPPPSLPSALPHVT